MKYLINYTFNGVGTCIVEADNEEKAEELFYEGVFTDEDESGSHDYEISHIEERE